MHFPTSFYITYLFVCLFIYLLVTLALGFLCSRFLSAVGPSDHHALLLATMWSCLLSPVRVNEEKKGESYCTAGMPLNLK